MTINWQKLGGWGSAAVLGLIQLGLLVAKLFGYVHWSWPLIFTPIWLPIVIVIIIAIIVIALFASSSGNPFQ